MKRCLVTAGLLVGLWCPWWTAAAAVDAITADDALAIHAAVQTQLDALANDDADSAFALASQERRQQIGSSDNFLRLIKEEYNPIYRYQRALFSSPEVLAGDAVQVVRVTDGYGKVWVALFWMAREEDGGWKIDGCRLLGTTAVSI